MILRVLSFFIFLPYIRFGSKQNSLKNNQLKLIHNTSKINRVYKLKKKLPNNNWRVSFAHTVVSTDLRMLRFYYPLQK